MPKNKQRSSRLYDINDWKWEFLRRNPRYIRAYKAIEWIKRGFAEGRHRNFFRPFGLYRHIDHYGNLVNALKEKCSLSNPKLKNESQQEHYSSDAWSLPPPDLTAHEFEYSPVRVYPVVGVYGHRDFEGDSLDPRAVEPAVVTAGEHEVVAVIDTRCNREDIVSSLKAELRPYLSKQRSQLKKYKDYLAVWDLRQKGLTAEEIASKLWPNDYEERGGRDDIGGKSALTQKVYDYEQAARRLIDKSFPPRKRPRKIKK